MQSNPFLEALKIGFIAILAFLVFLSFWQRTHLEDQVAGLAREQSALTDRVGDMARKVDDLKSKADRLEGAADTIAKVIASGGVRVGPVSDGGGTAAVTPPKARGDWGWPLNADLDRSPDPSRPPGTPGRYKNFVSLDP